MTHGWGVNYIADLERVVTCSMAWRTLLLALAVWSMSCEATAQAEETAANVEFYFDSNIGVSFGDFPFPGASLLGGVRKVSESGFVFEAEAGLAFPTVATGKVGVGIQRFAGGPSGTLGLRLWPLHLYYQQSIPTKRCERILSERARNDGSSAVAKTATTSAAAIGTSPWKRGPTAGSALTPKPSSRWDIDCFLIESPAAVASF